VRWLIRQRGEEEQPLTWQFVFVSSQLEEQRLYYERLLSRAHEAESHQHMTTLEHEKKQLKKANATLAEKAKKLEEELSFVRCVLLCCDLRAMVKLTLLRL
jgi:uncharacterized protein YlxW (UPF0749 family)